MPPIILRQNYMMQQDEVVKIGVGGSFLEPDNRLIVMETRQPLRHLTLRFSNVAWIAASTDNYFQVALAFSLNLNEMEMKGSCYGNQ